MSSLTVELTDVMKKCLFPNNTEQHWNYVNISCLQKHCFITCDDVVIFCQEIPLADQVVEINCEDFNNKDCFIIILTTNSSGCVLSLKENKVQEYFQENVKKIFIDDYICNGHEQLVCSFYDNDKEDDYYITDYDCCMYDTRTNNNYEDMFVNKRKAEPKQQYSDGYDSALSALNSKILSTTTLLHDEIAKRFEKEMLIKTTIDRSISQSVGKDHEVTSPPGLLDLLGETPLTTIHKGIVETRPFNIHDIWFKIYHNEIIFVVEIENTTKEDHFYNVSLQLVSTGSNCLSSTSDILYYDYKLEKEESAWKQQRLEVCTNSMYPGRRCTLVSSAQCPDIPSNADLEFELYVNYCNKNNQHFSICVGEQIISVQDMISDSNTVAENFSQRDARSNLVFSFLNHQENVTLTSKTSSLVSLPKLISDRLNCKSSHFGNAIVVKPMFLDSEIQFTNTSSSLDCTVYSKESKMLQSIFSELKKNLPADIQCGKKFDVVKIIVKQFYELLENEINNTIGYYESCFQQIEDDNERNQNVIIIDSPKRKRSVDNSYVEELHKKYVESVLNTDEFLIANASLIS